MMLRLIPGLTAALSLFSVALANVNNAAKSCACYTETECPKIPQMPTPKSCTYKPCLKIVEKTVPPHNTKCPTTSTVTTYTPGCPNGVFTCPSLCASTSTVTQTGCFTATTTTDAKTCHKTSTCTVPACLYITTTTVPPKLCACPTTGTITETNPCKCMTGCSITTKTVTATA